MKDKGREHYAHGANVSFLRIPNVKLANILLSQERKLFLFIRLPRSGLLGNSGLTPIDVLGNPEGMKRDGVS